MRQVIVLCLLACIGCGKQSTPSRTNSLPSKAAMATPSVSIDAKHLTDAYATELSADAAYKGKTILVKGNVVASASSEDGPLVTINNVYWPKETVVVCLFASTSEAAKLKSGQRVQVVGRCEGMKKFGIYRMVSLRDCCLEPD